MHKASKSYLLESQETPRILFRKIRKSDFNEWLEFHKNPETSKHWIAEFKSPKKECEDWYKNQFFRYKNNLGGMNALIDKQSGKLIGHCGLLIQTVDDLVELEIGYSLIPEFWNMGFATEAAIKCRDFAFENGLSDSLISIISLANKRSEKVALKNGMNRDKVTEYKGNKVNIFRINKSEWRRLNKVTNMG